MKNYKFLVPIAMVIIYAVSFYYLYDTKAGIQEQYDKYIEDARHYRSLKVTATASENYMNALNMMPSLELYMEIAEYYVEMDDRDGAIEWGKRVIEEYPKNKEPYEFLGKIYYNMEDWIAEYQLYDEMHSRGASSEYMEDIVASIEYEYYTISEYEQVGIYSDGMCPVKIGTNWGYVNEKGQQAIGRIFADAGYFFIETYAPVVTPEGDAYFIDKSGTKRHAVSDKIAHKKFGVMNEGMYSVYDGTAWYYYDMDENQIFGGYEEVSAIVNGIVAAKKDGEWSIVNNKGEAVIEQTYSDVVSDEKNVVFRNDRLFVSDGTGYMMIDSSGNAITEDRYEDARLFADTTLAAVKQDGKWGFIDNSGNMVIEPQFEDARSFINGKAAVMQDGKWGFIDSEGNMVIEAIYTDAKDFNGSGCAFVKTENGVWTLLCLYKYNHD